MRLGSFHSSSSGGLPLPLELLLFLLLSLTTTVVRADVGNLKMILDPSDVIYTSKVSYCAPPQAIVINRFDLRYIKSNHSVSFDIDAASVQPNLRARLDAKLQAYGMTPLNISLDLCDALGTALCPLPQYNFVGSASLTVPEQYTKSIPGIAYLVPDLQAVATVQLIDTSNNNVAACLQAHLSNTKTVHLPEVAWASAAILLASFLVACLCSLARSSDTWGPNAHAEEWRFLVTGQFLQHIFGSALLSLDYPTVYVSWAMNFAYSGFQIFVRTFTDSFNSMRLKTGGKPTTVGNNTFAATGINQAFVQPLQANVANLDHVKPGDLKGSWLTEGMEKVDIGEWMQSGSEQGWEGSVERVRTGAKDLVKRGMDKVVQGGGQQLGKRDIPVVKLDAGSAKNGIPIMTTRLTIAPLNAFMNAFVLFLLLIIVLAVLLGLIFGFMFLLSAFFRRRQSPASNSPLMASNGWKSIFVYFATTTTMRLLLLSYSAITIWTFYQWTLSDSWVPQLLSVFWFLILSGILLWNTSNPWRAHSGFQKHRNENGEGETEKGQNGTGNGNGDAASTRGKWRPGSLTRTWTFDAGSGEGQFRDPAARLYLPFMITGFVRALFIAFAQNHPLVQVVLLIVLESLIFIATLAVRPLPSCSSNFASVLLAFIRVVTYGLLTEFVPSRNIGEIRKVIIAFVILAIEALALLFLFFVMATNLILVVFRRKKAGKDSDGDGVRNDEENGEKNRLRDDGVQRERSNENAGGSKEEVGNVERKE